MRAGLDMIRKMMFNATTITDSYYNLNRPRPTPWRKRRQVATINARVAASVCRLLTVYFKDQRPDTRKDHNDGTLDGIDIELHPTAAKLVDRSKAFLTEVQHLFVVPTKNPHD